MGVAGKEFVFEFIGSGPPAGIFVKDICVGSHHIERYHRHHAVWYNGSGIGGAEIGCAYKRIDP